jgi:hypothetical protein
LVRTAAANVKTGRALGSSFHPGKQLHHFQDVGLPKQHRQVLEGAHVEVDGAHLGAALERRLAGAYYRGFAQHLLHRSQRKGVRTRAAGRPKLHLLGTVPHRSGLETGGILTDGQGIKTVGIGDRTGFGNLVVHVGTDQSFSRFLVFYVPKKGGGALSPYRARAKQKCGNRKNRNAYVHQ